MHRLVRNWIGSAAMLVAASLVFACKPEGPPATGPSIGGDTSPVFEEVAESRGIKFVHETGSTGTFFFPEIIGSGAAFLDYDRDGRLDVFLLNATWEAPHPEAAKTAQSRSDRTPSRLFRQEPDGNFTDVSAGSGLDVVGYGVGVAVGDVNNDAYPDVFVSNYGSARLFLNMRDGTFRDITQSAGIDARQWGVSACFLDYDRDGFLDLFLTNYVDYEVGRKCKRDDAGEDYCSPTAFGGTADKLFHNLSARTAPLDGSKAPVDPTLIRFEDASLSSGIASLKGPGLGVHSADFNGDGWQDLYVANDQRENFMWINQHDGTFKDEAVLWGVAYDVHGNPQASMGVALGDVDGNQLLDLICTHLNGETNTLYLNRLPVGFSDGSAQAGIFEPSFPMTGWGVRFDDLECDGDLDLVVLNGRVARAVPGSRDVPLAAPGVTSHWKPYAEENHVFLNDGQGHFSLAEQAGCPFRDLANVGRALASGDVDRDGDLDYLTTNVGGPVRLFRNQTPRRGHWIMVRATDPALGGRDALGAQIEVEVGGRKWTSLIQTTGSCMSASEPVAHVGLGEAASVDRISVRWPDGTGEEFTGGSADKVVVVVRGQGTGLGK
jgi:hypothetical protein